MMLGPRGTLSWIVGALLLAPVSLTAQMGAAPVGSTVRVFLQGDAQPLTGTLAPSSMGAWAVVGDDGALRTFRDAEVSSVEIERRGNRWKSGALIGGGAGLALALFVVSGTDCEEDIAGLCETVTGTTETAALIWLPVVGAGAGALVGALVGTRTWVPAVLPPTAVVEAELEFRWTIPIGENHR